MKNVLILAAGDISNKLSFIKAYYTSPALIPVNTKPLILYHLEFYSQFDCKIYLVVNQRDLQYIEESVNLNEYNFETLGVPDSHGVNDSLAYALDNMPPSDETIVNLVTSIPLEFPQPNTVYLQSSLTYNNSWSGIKIIDSEFQFSFKRDEQKRLSNAFTGILNIDSVALSKIIKSVNNQSDLLEVVKIWYSLYPNQINYRLADWIDAGHELNYYQSKLTLISSRSFNAVSVNNSGVLTKRSTNYNKLKDEVSFIKAIPSNMSIYFPRIIEDFTYDSENKRGSYAMEFYSYPSLAELQLYWDLRDEIWERIFADLKKVLSAFKEVKYSIGKEAYHAFYTGKIELRVTDFHQSLDKDFRYLIEQDLVINGLPCKSYESIKERLFQRIDSMYAESDFCIAHGDFCFNNILYDPSHRLIKLIDPRGSFGDKCKGLYGDTKYDLAKLMHSALSGYDYIVNNLYKLEFLEESVNYRILFKNNVHSIQAHAIKVIEELGYSYRDIMLLVGTLFISMTPLHADSCNRQKIMYIHGIKIINENI